MHLNAAALKTIRQRTGLSLRALATETNLAHSYIQDLESGRRTNPSDATIQALANGLRIPITAITSNEREPAT